MLNEPTKRTLWLLCFGEKTRHDAEERNKQRKRENGERNSMSHYLMLTLWSVLKYSWRRTVPCYSPHKQRPKREQDATNVRILFPDKYTNSVDKTIRDATIIRWWWWRCEITRNDEWSMSLFKFHSLANANYNHPPTRCFTPPFVLIICGRQI